MSVINRKGLNCKRTPIFVVGGVVLFLLFVFYQVFIASVQAATAPAMITYQGKVLVNGLPATTTQNIIFILYDASSGGTALYSASGTVGTPLSVAIAPNQGLFSVDLGDTGTVALDQTIFKNNSALYLEVRIGGETLTPRKRITAAPLLLIPAIWTAWRPALPLLPLTSPSPTAEEILILIILLLPAHFLPALLAQILMPTELLLPALLPLILIPIYYP